MQEEYKNLNSNSQTTPKKTSGVGPLIGSIVIVLLLLLGGLYYWGYVNYRQEQEKEMEQLEKEISSIEDDFVEFENELNFEIEGEF